MFNKLRYFVDYLGYYFIFKNKIIQINILSFWYLKLDLWISSICFVKEFVRNEEN